MPFFNRLLLCLALITVPTIAAHAAPEALTPPAGGTPLFPGDLLAGFNFGSPKYGSKTIVDVTGLPFKQALAMTTTQQPENRWDIQITQTIPTAIHKGDVLWISVWMRATHTTAEAHEGFSELSLELNHAPNSKIGVFEMSAGSEWQQYAWTCTAYNDYVASDTQICMRGGYKPQTIELGGFQLINYGAKVKMTDLPHSKITYPGIEADAPWRKAAADRIEKYRKGDIKVVVKDAAGKPVEGATVHIEEKHGAFGFGTCVQAKMIEGTGPDADKYREIVKKSYNKVVMENDLKWPSWDGGATDGHKTTLDAIHWLRDQGLEVRGHNLIWPSWHFCPPDVVALKGDPVALEKRIESHIKDEVEATKGLLSDWDVVNEPYANHEITDLLPPGTMASWFKLAHQLDPKPVLFLNDYAGLVARGEDTPHKQAFEKALQSLKKEGAPIGGLGLQSHFGQGLTPPEALVKELDRWAALGLDIQITEFDVDVDNEQTQAQYTRDFMTAVFSHPKVTALLSWGFWEKAHWKPAAAYYHADWSIKPNGQVWDELVLKEWHTDATEKTNASGTVATRGFLGDYEITVTHAGKTKTVPLSLTKDGANLAITLP